MEVHKIKAKYCKDNKVQVMFSNAAKQIICSKDGYLYLRDGDNTIHRYLDDSTRNKMPFKRKPSSSYHATHLFEYDKIYAKFTSNRNMGNSFLVNDGSYVFTFLYFIKNSNNEAICAEFHLSDFKKEEQEITLYTAKELEEFLYKIRNVDGKCIFKYWEGIQYAKFKNEPYSIDRGFLDISDSGIIQKYNSDNGMFKVSLFDEELRKKQLAERSWEVSTIDEVKKVNLTERGGFILSSDMPLLLVIDGDSMSVYEFSVTYCKKDCFEVRSTKREILITRENIIKNSTNSEYTREPDFSE